MAEAAGFACTTPIHDAIPFHVGCGGGRRNKIKTEVTGSGEGRAERENFRVESTAAGDSEPTSLARPLPLPTCQPSTHCHACGMPALSAAGRGRAESEYCPQTTGEARDGRREMKAMCTAQVEFRAATDGRLRGGRGGRVPLNPVYLPPSLSHLYFVVRALTLPLAPSLSRPQRRCQPWND